jgi:hypothetical protein
MLNNIKLLEFCFKNKESYIDEYYVKSSEPIISNSIKKMNALMRANTNILDNISAYKIAAEAKNSALQKTAFKNIIKALNTSGINFSEFTNYWAIKDMSYSVYKKTLQTDKLKMEFLKKILPEFIKDRHLLYKMHGYSFSTLQVVSDSKAHKKTGPNANSKVSEMLGSFGFSHLNSNDLNVFIKKDKIYIYPDKTEKKLFKKIIKHYNIEFKWSHNHEDKQTDFLFKSKDKIFIMEHKHMKESGGGQDKQMSEIIDFISYKDSDVVHYISFLDGVYFNLLADKNIASGKSFTQRNSIYNNLEKNKQNYFINTQGFTKLVKSL